MKLRSFWPAVADVRKNRTTEAARTAERILFAFIEYTFYLNLFQLPGYCLIVPDARMNVRLYVRTSQRLLSDQSCGGKHRRALGPAADRDRSPISNPSGSTIRPHHGAAGRTGTCADAWTACGSYEIPAAVRPASSR